MARTARTATLVLGDIAGAADLVDAIIARIADGALADGDRLPSTRALAEQTGLSRGTVVRAFDELAAAGFVASEHGSGTSVSGGAAQAARAGARTRGVGKSRWRPRRRPFPSPVGAVRRATSVPARPTPRWWMGGHGGRRCGRPRRRA
ncbi:GntR family transcriptional regulator [Dietzia aerolata]|uniref:GntR family transcriptional regulator n=1 Tax=Dietzia aerolata TaxID=595984 RepID=UPI00362A1380